MGEKRDAALRALDDAGIAYKLSEHRAVYTIEEMVEAGIEPMERVAKNLFLRDDKKRGYYLVTMAGAKHADLKELQRRLGTRRLSFASEEDLGALLKLEKGAVTPLGLLGDEEQRVTLVLDRDVLDWDVVGVHPCENTATVWLTLAALDKLARARGNVVLIERL